MGHALAVDLGGTNMRVAVVDPDGTILARAAAPTPRRGPDIEPLVELARGVGDGYELEHALVGVPGRVDHQLGVVLDAPNLPSQWAPRLTRVGLEAAFDLPVALANDADIAAVGEAYFGAGRGHTDLVYLTVSTGVGAGILVGGRIVLPRYSAGEVGHSVVDRALAAAGGDGTVEGLGSGTALARRARAVGLDVPGAALVRLIEGDDPVATALWDDAMLAVGIGVVNLAHLVAPTIVVVGGGVGRNGELVNAPIRTALERWGPVGPHAEVVTAELGDDPGLVGAAAWRAAT